MQDRFKFRAWHKPLKQMHYNDFVVTATGYVAKIYQQDDYMIKFNQQDLEFDKQCAVMQCTGLKDKNGKLIFEGDIIKQSDGCIGYVVWQGVSYWIESPGSHARDLESVPYYETIEVIGNIYKNKELLNEI